VTAALIWCPFPDDASASAAAKSLLDEKLIACANILPQIHSIFDWNGQRGESREVGMLAKTEAELLERAIARIAKLHPYEQPAIVGWRCDAASPATLAWLEWIAT
jgi:periplasmic divalent cation tolerance protein